RARGARRSRRAALRGADRRADRRRRHADRRADAARARALGRGEDPAMTRPAIAPDVAAALTAQIPSRLIKKLDSDPTLAERWTWSDMTVKTDKGEVVTLALTAGVVPGVTCTCLLQPKCLHVAAVVALLEPADAPAAAAPVKPAAVATPSTAI